LGFEIWDLGFFMRSLEQALSDHDLVLLRVIGEWWELDLTGEDRVTSIKAVAEALTGLDLAEEIHYLQPEETAAMQELVRAGGRLPVATFSRDHGDVRLMGPGRLEREEPWLDPVSAAEGLWYRGFLFRGFDETDEGMVEFFYLPTELYRKLGGPSSSQKATTTTAAGVAAPAAVERLQPVQPPFQISATSADAVDDLTAILAQAQNTPLREENLEWLRPLLLDPNPERTHLLITLAWEMQLLRQTDEGARPSRPAAAWLKKSREEQLRTLADAWSNTAWNDLCHTPGLVCEGDSWQNDPLLARTALLDAVPRQDDWFLLDELVAQVKENDPDFQRPDGNYDTWYIRHAETDAYITGFANWEQVEGQVLRFLMRGPMHWLGLADLGGDRYRLTPRALAWLTDRPPAPDDLTLPIVVQPDATILVPATAGRYQRFQVARISQAEPVVAGKPFVYRLTPPSLTEAAEQNINPERVVAFLEEAGGRPIPASAKRAIERWAERGTEGRLTQAVILRVRSADILDTLRNNAKTRPYIEESLGDLAAIVRREDWQKLRQAAAQLGLLLESD
jgi:hypothetical protein